MKRPPWVSAKAAAHASAQAVGASLALSYVLSHTKWNAHFMELWRSGALFASLPVALLFERFGWSTGTLRRGIIMTLVYPSLVAFIGYWSAMQFYHAKFLGFPHKSIWDLIAAAAWASLTAAIIPAASVALGTAMVIFVGARWLMRLQYRTDGR